MVWVVIHIRDGVFCGIDGAADDMEAIEVSDIAGVTVGNAVFVQAIGKWALLDRAAFLLAIATKDHEKSR